MLACIRVPGRKDPVMGRLGDCGDALGQLARVHPSMVMALAGRTSGGSRQFILAALESASAASKDRADRTESSKRSEPTRPKRSAKLATTRPTEPEPVETVWFY